MEGALKDLPTPPEGGLKDLPLPMEGALKEPPKPLCWLNVLPVGPRDPASPRFLPVVDGLSKPLRLLKAGGLLPLPAGV